MSPEKESRLLFLSTKATRPSHRFRVEQMLPYLEQRGHQCSVGFFPKNPIARIWFYRQLSKYDAVVIQQRTLDPIELKLVRGLSTRLIFDLDDSVMFDAQGNPDKRRQRRFNALVRCADLVICGNQFLRDRVEDCLVGSAIKPPIEILPTAIDTERFHPGIPSLCHSRKPSNLITIGWTGSRSTIPYLNNVLPVLAQFAGRAELKIISDTTQGLNVSQLGSLPFRFVKWTAEVEVAETAEFDIGLMPLPDDNATRGKCGCKALQYMALGIPAVCSPVGVNRDIIQHGLNGYLPESDQEWSGTIDDLLGNASLRQRIARAGRLTVDSQYSLREVVSRLAGLLERCDQSTKYAA